MSRPEMSRRLPRRLRRRIVAAGAVIVVALVVAAAGWIGAVHSAPAPSAGDRTELERAAGAAVEALFTFAPGADPASVRTHLTDPLLTRYATVGADVVLPGAVAGQVTGAVQLVGIGVAEYADQRARVLVAINQELTSNPAGAATPEPEHTPSEKWVVMRKVDGIWLMADVAPVGDLTR
ncbi:MAG: hypothetical protein QM662_19600 [Gordonia sp. (in: high G+C Gram-positive bacteria)]